MSEKTMVSFKLEPETLRDLDALSLYLAAKFFSGRPNRTAALRYAVSVALEGLGGLEKNSRKSGKKA